MPLSRKVGIDHSEARLPLPELKPHRTDFHALLTGYSSQVRCCVVRDGARMPAGVSQDIKELLEDGQDLEYEEEIARNPYSLKNWLRYLDSKPSAKPVKRYFIYERSVRNTEREHSMFMCIAGGCCVYLMQIQSTYVVSAPCRSVNLEICYSLIKAAHLVVAFVLMASGVALRW